ncbi:MAG: hypothetical protein GY828_04390 [Candidatus Gracilibacteria bacterium]|nr:hypothetical protein [Candidatus Gracilibacteria bacterium]
MKKNIGALTLMELVIAVTISAIVLLFAVGYIADILGYIGESRRQVVVTSHLNNYMQSFQNTLHKYPKPTILVDYGPGIGNDVLLLEDPSGTGGVIFTVVDIVDDRPKDNTDFSTYHEQILGYRELDNSELTALKGNTGSYVDYTFFGNKLFHELQAKEFQVDIWNSGSGNIIDMNLEIYNNRYPDFVGVDVQTIPAEYFTKYNYSF